MKASDLEKVRDKMQELRLAKMERDAIVCANTINVSVGDTYSPDLHLNPVAPIHGCGAGGAGRAGFYARRTSARD